MFSSHHHVCPVSDISPPPSRSPDDRPASPSYKTHDLGQRSHHIPAMAAPGRISEGRPSAPPERNCVSEEGFTTSGGKTDKMWGTIDGWCDDDTEFRAGRYVDTRRSERDVRETDYENVSRGRNLYRSTVFDALNERYCGQDHRDLEEKEHRGAGDSCGATDSDIETDLCGDVGTNDRRHYGVWDLEGDWTDDEVFDPEDAIGDRRKWEAEGDLLRKYSTMLKIPVREAMAARRADCVFNSSSTYEHRCFDIAENRRQIKECLTDALDTLNYEDGLALEKLLGEQEHFRNRLVLAISESN